LVGFHQEPARELRLDYCLANGIDINRRLSGGGALLFQPSALGWELIAPLGAGPFWGGFQATLERICRSAASAFSRLGIKADFRPRNDIEVHGRKISGTGGFVLEGGALFQGTVLVKNEVEQFLKALRVPVEKLKKREIESLMQRLAFLEDLLGGPLDLDALKRALVEQFTEDLAMEFTPGTLTPDEQGELETRLPHFRSEQWLRLERPAGMRPAWLKETLQTDAGTLRVTLWLDRRGRRVQKALISGDFFSQPQRLIYDLEAALMGAKAEPQALAARVEEFLGQADGELVGIAPGQAAQAVARAAARRALWPAFDQEEAAELMLVGMDPAGVAGARPGWLLLPYCAKPLICGWREQAGCGGCGECDLHQLHELAEALAMEPVTIQSFEHLMETLAQAAREKRAFLGSCCQAFHDKHQAEMENSGAAGLLVNLDSTTCYDLGKGQDAYVGRFDHQTFLNLPLIRKAARVMAGGDA
jgi:lipoate-protein ligase A